jgi:phytoene synthase
VDADEMLANWRERLVVYPNVYDPVPLAWRDTKTRHQVPQGYETQLIEGIARDLRQNRYRTFAELTEYCYGVASTVGLMAMHIIGFKDRRALPYAVKLGVALQLTNILRDVGEDYLDGRIYLPQEDLRRFEYGEDDLARGLVDRRFRALMDFEIARTRRLYAEAWRGIRLLSRDGRLAIAAAADFYRAILDQIERNDYDVFNQRAHLNAAEKLVRLPKLWWDSQRM